MTALRAGVLAYGPDSRMHREATVALLTLRAFLPAGAELIVFTDAPAKYRWMADAITIETLSDTVIDAWRGPSNDRFRPKIETLRQMHAGGTDALLVDTDTMARAPLAPLAEHLARGGFVLHAREYSIVAPPRRGDRRLRHEIAGKKWAGISADATTSMWNGGVIGASGRHPDVVTRTLTAFDEMRHASRHFALEQLAYSIVFPAYGPLRAADDLIDHYWANRLWFDRRIDRFLGDVLMEGMLPAEAVARLRQQPIAGPLDGRLRGWQRRMTKLLRIELDDDV